MMESSRSMEERMVVSVLLVGGERRAALTAGAHQRSAERGRKERGERGCGGVCVFNNREPLERRFFLLVLIIMMVLSGQRRFFNSRERRADGKGGQQGAPAPSASFMVSLHAAHSDVQSHQSDSFMSEFLIQLLSWEGAGFRDNARVPHTLAPTSERVALAQPATGNKRRGAIKMNSTTKSSRRIQPPLNRRTPD